MIPIQYPRTYQDIDGYYITHRMQPPSYEIEFRDGHAFDENGNLLPDGWYRAYEFGAWDVPRDEADRTRILKELREEENRIWRQLDALHNLRDAIRQRVTVEQLNEEMHG